ncbi:Flp family type IVb pilin [Isosphaeraceae bacterium EP7]
MSKFFKRLMTEQDGATMVEYALMIALIGAAAVAAITTLSTAISGKFTDVGTAVTSAGS